MAKRPQAHKIDDAAKRVFHEVFDDVSWIIKSDPDYGFDYRVQMLRRASVSWQVCLIQLKGHNRFARARVGGLPVVKQAITRDRLVDYADTYREPVFIVVVDVAESSARYLFVQEYLDKQPKAVRWRQQASSTLYVPEANDLRDQSRFQNDLAHALRYMQDKYPGSIEAALRSAKEEYIKIDPRFDVRWELKEGKVAPHFTPKEEVTFNIAIRAKGDDAAARIGRLIESGLETTFTKDEVSLTGSPLLERAMAGGSVKIRLGSTHDILLSLVRQSADGLTQCSLEGLRGLMSVGREAYSFNAALPGEILCVAVKAVSKNGGYAPMQLTLKVDAWFRSPVHALPYFDALHSLFVEHGASTLAMKVLLLESGASQSHVLGAESSEQLSRLSALLGEIRMLRLIAERLQIQPVMRRSLRAEDRRDIYRVYKMLVEGRCESIMTTGTVTVVLNRAGAKSLARAAIPCDVSVPGTERIDFFSTPYEIGICQRVFRQLYVHNKSDVFQQLDDPNNDDIKVVLQGGNGSTLTETLAVAVRDLSQPS